MNIKMTFFVFPDKPTCISVSPVLRSGWITISNPILSVLDPLLILGQMCPQKPVLIDSTVTWREGQNTEDLEKKPEQLRHKWCIKVPLTVYTVIRQPATRILWKQSSVSCSGNGQTNQSSVDLSPKLNCKNLHKSFWKSVVHMTIVWGTKVDRS